MYLKALEICGFKSFPEKTRLTFDKPVTGIVGPNGSGKSNISDAVLWVTGEQSSKALRGGKMEDVIFGGTQKRGPMGYAEVSLVFDNSGRFFDMDNTEVMITRRYYRTGDSEYYINRQSVRLRDVNELLMDTGMGHEGYSIIGQGKIDAILSAKSTDRREIFEEAAGISRYRHRKEEAQRRLERTDENMLRINDKISELELQVQPLKKQSEVAKKYLVLRDELRGLEISVWLERLERLQLQLEQLEGNLGEKTRELESTNAELDELYEKSELFSQQMREKDVYSDNLRGKSAELETARSACESDLAVLRANLDNNVRQVERIKQDIEKQHSQDEGIGAQIEDRRRRIDELTAQTEELTGKIEELEENMRLVAEESGRAAAALNELLARQSENDHELSLNRQELSAFASAAQTLEDRDVSVRREIAASSDKLKELVSASVLFREEVC
ncbi:MAG: AAA family ATPase [Oscillospiraceae bacterium]|nr:AAA family ATPase [Oscillospiraceae bacterium]